MRFAISYSTPMRLLSIMLGTGPRRSSVDVDDDTVDVRMGWAFHVAIPRSAVDGVRHAEPVRFSRGAHGWNGRYLVNGRGDGLVTITVEPAQRGVLVGFPVNVSEVTVSVEDPAGLVAALSDRSAT